MEDTGSGDGILIMAVNTFIEMSHLARLPFSVKLKYPLTTASYTLKTLRPSDALKVGNAFFFGIEALKVFKDRWLRFHEQSIL